MVAKVMKVVMKGKSTKKAEVMKKTKKRTSIIARGKAAKSKVFRGVKVKTPSGLQKKDLIKNKYGKVVSKKASEAAKRSFQGNGLDKRAAAVKNARKALGITGFVPIGGKSERGQALLKKVREELNEKPGGKVVTKKSSEADKGKNSMAKFSASVMIARKALGITGFAPIGGQSAVGQALLKRAKEEMQKMPENWQDLNIYKEEEPDSDEEEESEEESEGNELEKTRLELEHTREQLVEEKVRRHLEKQRKSLSHQLEYSKSSLAEVPCLAPKSEDDEE